MRSSVDSSRYLTSRNLTVSQITYDSADVDIALTSADRDTYDFQAFNFRVDFNFCVYSRNYAYVVTDDTADIEVCVENVFSTLGNRFYNTAYYCNVFDRAGVITDNQTDTYGTVFRNVYRNICNSQILDNAVVVSE